jgi:hypothetical protein
MDNFKYYLSNIQENKLVIPINNDYLLSDIEDGVRTLYLIGECLDFTIAPNDVFVSWHEYTDYDNDDIQKILYFELVKGKLVITFRYVEIEKVERTKTFEMDIDKGGILIKNEITG